MITAKLELEKKEDQDTISYRYRFDTCKVWFSQNTKSGNIFGVSVVDEQYPDVEYHVYDIDDRCYPSMVSLDFPRHRIRAQFDFDVVTTKLNNCNNRRYAIERFLLSSSHYNLWLAKHKGITYNDNEAQ